MPGLVKSRPFSKIQVKELHPTFGAEIEGVDFASRVPDDVFAEILEASARVSKPSRHVRQGTEFIEYGVLVFRSTGLDDTQHVEFSRRFGELDDTRPYMTDGRKPRYEYYELFDAGNIDAETGEPLDPASPRAQYNKGNALFHVDSSFNPRRASFSILKATELPPPETGGATDFADTRTAFDELRDDLKKRLLENDYFAAHSLHHSRKMAAPEFFEDTDPAKHKMHYHRIAQKHEPSDRMNLYIAAHAHHIEGLPPAESDALLKDLMDHATQEKYCMSVPWKNKGDLVIWDNTCVMHRAGKGTFAGKFKRDLRRTTVHDSSSQAWGSNSTDQVNPGFKMPV